MFDTGPGTFSSDLTAIVAACLLMLLPALVGALAAAGLRRLKLPPRLRLASAALLVLAPVAASLVAIPRIDTLSFWDVLGVGLAVAAGALVVLVQAPGPVARPALAAVGRAAVGLLAVEFFAVVLLPPAPPVPPPASARLVLPVTNRDPPCNVMFASDRAVREELTAGVAGRPTVLHIGDSLVAGNGVAKSENFVAALGRTQPGVRHVNLGASGASPEAYLLALSHWTASTPARLAVVYVFAGNDIADLGVHYLCCGEEPLLREDGGHLAPRCTTARWSIPLGMHLATSPPPFALRVLASDSRAAGYLLGLTMRMQQAAFRRGLGDIAGQPRGSGPPRWDFFAAVMRDLRETAAAHHTPLLVVALPTRPTLERSLGRTPVGNDYWRDLEHGLEGRRRIVETARAAGLDVIDAWDVVRAAIEERGSAAVFAHDYPGDVHLGVFGHERVAAWLLDALRARGVTDAPGP